MPFIRRAVHWLANQLPNLCAVCRCATCGVDEGVCRDCVERFAPRVTRCPTCALRSPRDDLPCGACQRLPARWHRAIAAFDYDFPWDRLIRELKFGESMAHVHPLTRCLCNAVRAAHARVPLPTRVVPVPLSRARLRERGFNPSWEIARRLARALDLDCSQTLQRVRETPPQSSLPRLERAKNVLGAFRAVGAARIEGEHLALVDDVMTTGATLAAATCALLDAGAARVDVWVLARTGID
ncbi:MAG TPA: ComF family protein [Burkholderiaceae bacterium]|jgi:ComF family protein|nr:ComF family protein [Burkholderiaceae bacterium]